MSDTIPTTEEVRDDYSYCGEYVPPEMEKREDFDRWLAERDAQKWDEGHESGQRWESFESRGNPGEEPDVPFENPYR